MGIQEDGTQAGGTQESSLQGHHASQPAAKRGGTPVWARKSSLVLIIAAMALAAFGSTTQTWLTVHLDPAQLGQAVNSQDGLQVQGSKAATTVTALALVALAGGLAASIAGRIARWIITAIIVLASAGIVTAAVTVMTDPLAAAQGSIAAATGITGSSVQVSVSAFPGTRRRRRPPAGAGRAADHPGGSLLEDADQVRCRSGRNGRRRRRARG